MLRTQILTNEHKAVIECVRRKDLKHPELVIKVSDGVYEHPARGKSKKFFVFHTMRAYQHSPYYGDIAYRLHRVNSFYIVEKI